ncbi:sugar transporter [Poseidonocella sedimentorum]|uniref:Capsular polysaccharide transport system permease protein n=1 Tax=Poseidonocella sedimentorum TaxID=871652 RepID=A0A1I6EDH7_9RHOB|nr:sugar transporter [Poseidonocella sedimentorum]SFR15578.1 capsular polysaccharide transport system permease protein [Poseidonocella sedimentorum]
MAEDRPRSPEETGGAASRQDPADGGKGPVAAPSDDAEAAKAKRVAARAAKAEAKARRAAEQAAERVSEAGGMAPRVQPTVAPVRARRRHWGLLVSFVLLVLCPTYATYWYLSERTADQFASDIGFTVRREETPSAVDILGGFSNLSTAASSDSDILYKFILSRELLEIVDAELDLRRVYSRHHETDPIFSLAPEASVEQLLAFWQRMVRVSYTSGTGLIEVKTLAFTPEDAKLIAELIFRESSRMINDLSAIAREDAMRYAREELAQAEIELKAARQAITTFRSRNQIVDVQADIQLQMGLLASLQQQLGEELINFDLLSNSARDGDPRLSQARLRIDVIRRRIAEEREKFGTGTAGGVDATVATRDYATVVAEFEALTVEREFAETRYTGALTNFETSRASAQRQSRYLAAFVQPTLAQTPEFPRRTMIFGLACLFLVAGWAILCLIYYSLRDRR